MPKKGSKLLIPLPPDVERARAEAKASHDHVLPEDMTLLEAAATLGVEAPLLLRLNQVPQPGLTRALGGAGGGCLLWLGSPLATPLATPLRHTPRHTPPHTPRPPPPGAPRAQRAVAVERAATRHAAAHQAGATYLLPTAHRLLPTAYCPLPCLLPTAYYHCPLRTAHYSPLTTHFPLTAHRPPPTTRCLGRLTHHALAPRRMLGYSKT